MTYLGSRYLEDIYQGVGPVPPPPPEHEDQVAHWHSDDLGELDPDDPVANWLDRVSGILLTATGTTRPLYRATGTHGLGDIRTAEFDGSNDVLEGGNLLSLAGKAGFTIIALIHPDRDMSGSGTIIARSSSSNRGFRLAIDGASGLPYVQVATGASTFCQRAAATAMAKYFPMALVAKYDGAAGDLDLLVNGVLDNGTLTGTVPATVANAGSNLRVGSDGHGDEFNGHIAEIRVFDAALSDEDLQAFTAQMIERAGLYVLQQTSFSGDLNSHQGIAVTPDHYITIHDNNIQKRSKVDYSLIDQNSSPFSGLSGGQNHLTDGAYHDGKIYTEMEDDPDTGADHYIGVFDADTLARIDEQDIGEPLTSSGIAIDPNAGIVYGCDHSSGSGIVLQKWNLSDLSYIGSVATDFPAIATEIQGISLNPDDGLLWGSFGNNSNTNGLIVTFDPATGAHRPIYRRYLPSSIAEGIDVTQSGVMHWLLDHGTDERDHVYGTVAPSIGGPDRPTLTVTPASVSADMEGSAYSHPDELRHKASQFQAATDSGFGSVVYDETDEYIVGEAPATPAHTATNLLASTTYYFRHRYQDEDENWSPWSFTVEETTEAGNPPDTPSILSATPSYDQVSLVASELSDPVDPDRTVVEVDWQIDEAGGDFSTPVVESLADPLNLLSITLGGLAAETDYIARHRKRVDDGSYSAYSASFPFTTTAAPASPPATPTASLHSKTSASITIQGTSFLYPGQPYTHAETLLEVSTSPTFSPATTVQVSFIPGQTSGLLAENLSPGTQYWYRIRYRASNDIWTAWSAAPNTTTLTDALAGAFLIVTAPRHGAVIRGAAVPITFTPASSSGITFEAQYTSDWSTWLPITTGAASPLAWNVSSLTDGVYGLRVRATDDASPTRWEYRAVVVDNANDPLIFNRNYDDGYDLSDFTPTWNTDGHTWDRDGQKIIDIGSRLSKNGWAALAFEEPKQPRDLEVLIEVGNWSQGGSFPWSWFPEQCDAGAAFGADIAGTDITDGLVATFSSVPIWPYGSCFESGRGPGTLTIEGYEGGVRTFSQPVNIGHVHFLKTWDGCLKVPRYGVRLRLTTLENLAEGKRRVRIQAAVLGMEIDTEAVGEWHHVGTWITSLDCGKACFGSREITTSRAYRTFTNITVIPLDYGTCEAPEAWVPPTGGAGETVGRPCTLILQVYEEDRETIAWEVGTDPDHPAPYLCLPENYDEQEIDVVAGAATIGQVEVVVIDPNQIRGDQYSGWMTERLSVASITAIHGRRCRLIRFISVELGWIVIADGPAGTPRMDSSYAAYRWVIRDTRETERKIRAFVETSGLLLPPGSEAGWGKYGPTDYLVPPTDPLVGEVFDALGIHVYLDAYWVESFSGPLGQPSIGSALSDDAVVLVTRDPFSPTWDGEYWHYPELEVAWRYVGETEWNVVTPRYPDPDGTEFPRTIAPWRPAVSTEGIDVDAAYALYLHFETVLGEAIPSVGQTVEVIVRYRGAAREEIPVLIEFKSDGSPYTTGELLRDLYDGLYSPRDPVTGEVVPTGILYDEDAVLQMTDPVRLRLTEPVEDLRDWTEKYIYGPSGWVPALDRDLFISPVSQVPPQSTDGLVDVHNGVTEPSPDWNAGERIVNLLTFNYPRWYPDPDTFDSIDRLQERSVSHIVLDQDSIRDHGEQKVTYEGIAFSAVGDEFGDPLVPLSEEIGYPLFLDRKLYVFDRFVHGAQAIQVVVRRSVTALLRAGDWVTVDLTWFPDYLLQRRHMQTMGQIIAIADLDCAWRRLLIEEAFPPELES